MWIKDSEKPKPQPTGGSTPVKEGKGKDEQPAPQPITDWASL